MQILPRLFPDAVIVVSSRDNTVSIQEAAQCDLVIPAVPISAFEEVISEIGHSIGSGSVVMDVCAVKVFPAECMTRVFPEGIQLIASHPMFGPGTLKKTHGSLSKLKWVMYPLRIKRQDFLEFQKSVSTGGIDIVEITPQEHDVYAAEFHFTAHVTAAILKEIGVKRTPIDTRSAESLFEFMEMVHTDSPSLLKEMMRYNPYCRDQLQKMKNADEHIISLLSS